MAVQTYSYTEINSALSGYFNQTSDTTRMRFSDNAVMFLILTGTEAIIKAGGGGPNPFKVIVDGVESVPTLVNNTITLFSGLTDEPHKVLMIPEPAYITNNNWITREVADCLTITGSIPNMETVPFEFISWSSFVGISTQPSNDAFGGDITPLDKQVAPNTAARGMISFKSQCDTIYTFSDSPLIYYSIDNGVIQSVVTTTGVFRYPAQLITGLDNTVEHIYTIWDGEQDNYPVQAIACTNGSVSANILSPLNTGKTVYQFGDSITFGAGANPGDVDCWGIGLSLDLPVAKMGVSGQTTPELTGMIPSYFPEIDIPDVVLLATGRNDTASGTIQADYTACIQAFLDVGCTKIVCRGILPESTEIWSSQNAEIELAIASFSSSDIVFMDTQTWAGIATLDGVHPTAIGYEQIVAYEETPLQAILDSWFESFSVKGVTYDKDGTILPSCQVTLFKHTGVGVYTYIDTQESNAITGVYDFSPVTDNDSSYMIYAHKTGVFDCTDNNITPVEV